MNRPRSSSLRARTLSAFLVAAAAAGPMGFALSVPQTDSMGGMEVFDGKTEGSHEALETAIGKISGPGCSLRVMQRLGGDVGNLALRLGAPRDKQKMPTVAIRIDLARAVVEGTLLSMDIQRAARRKRFHLAAEYRGGSKEGARVDLTGELLLNEFRPVDLVLPAGTTAVVFHLTAPPTIGVDLDNLTLRAPSPMQVTGASARYVTEPACVSRIGGPALPAALAKLEIVTNGVLEPRVLESLRARVTAPGTAIHSLRLVDSEGDLLAEGADAKPGKWFVLEPRTELRHGANAYRLLAELGVASDPTAFSAAADSGYLRLPGRPFSIEIEFVVSGESKRTVPLTGTPPRTAHMFGPLGQAVEGTALVAVRAQQGQPTTLVGAVTQKVDGRRWLRFFRSDAAGLLSAPVREELGLDPKWDCYAPTLIQERPSGFVHVFFMVDRARGTEIWRARSEDRGSTWGQATPLPWTWGAAAGPTADARKRPLNPHLTGGRGVQSSQGPWALLVQIPNQVGHRLLVSRDGGLSFKLSRSSEVPSEGGTLVELGPGGLLVDSHLPGSQRRYLVSTTTFAEQWTHSLSKRRPLLSCAGLGAATLHVGRDLFGAEDYRLLFSNVATGPDAPAGLTVRGSNDNGDNWFDRVSLVVDEGEGADLPALGILDKATVCVLYLSSHGELCVQYIEFPAVIENAMSFYDVFGAGSGLKR